MKRICFVIPYFGAWPSWLPYFLRSCGNNPSVDWLIFTDLNPPANLPSNVQVVDLSLRRFNRLASRKLGFTVFVEHPYKLCDLRPAFALIFDDYLRGYDFWGHTDLDVIYGNIRGFVTEDMLSKFDVITSNPHYLVGHFTLYRNTKKMNHLFEENPNYVKIFKSKQYLNFDECACQFQALSEGKQLGETQSMTYIVRRKTELGEVDACFGDMSGRPTAPDSNIKLFYENGRLTRKEDGEEMLYFHFQYWKENYLRYIKAGDLAADRFHITDKDIHTASSLRERLIRGIRVKPRAALCEIDRYLGLLGMLIRERDEKTYRHIKGFLGWV